MQSSSGLLTARVVSARCSENVLRPAKPLPAADGADLQAQLLRALPGAGDALVFKCFGRKKLRVRSGIGDVSEETWGEASKCAL